MELLGLSFRPGVGVQAMIKSKFSCSVSPIVLGRDFFLIASFRCCKFKLCPTIVGLLLQATLGGLAEDFAIVHLSNRVFLFFGFLQACGFLCP